MADDEQAVKRARTGDVPDDASAAAPPGVELYSYWRSSSSWRVRIALHHKGIPFAYHAVHLVKNEQFADDYVEKNKFKQVPTLVHGGAVITQSPAIIEYLEEVQPEPALLPGDALLRARTRELAAMIGCDIQPVQNLRVLRRVMDLRPDDADAQKMQWGKHFIELGFAGLEKALAGTAGLYCVGDDVTLADLFLVPQVYNARRFGVDMAQYPTILAINDRLEQLPAFKAAHPSAQPDAEA